ncbi:GH19052 [Drosophila grimshawi]|uniref:GH19052 n=1 Tax=Drosophila grimshawi TaxID=7222 RepID=B4JI91_DROGR|nr:GH19052 [Drosophila grimshawi]
MPKKVITRRQRKAAEAKRQAEGNSHLSTTDPQIENLGARPVGALNYKPSCKCCKPKPLQTQKMLAGGVVTNTERTSIVAEDKITKSEIMNMVTNIAPGLMLPPPSPATPGNEPISFSKSLTRQAVATFNKIQKLSKAFNKKMNHKQPTAKVADPTNSTNGVQLDDNEDAKLNQQCSCEFCKVVINQMLARKNQSNGKNCCKNPGKRPGNHRHSVTPPSRNVTPKSQQSEEGELAPPSVTNGQRIAAMLQAKRKLLNKNNHGQNPKSSKMVKKEQPVKKDKPKTQINEATQKDITPDAKQNSKNPEKNNITSDQKSPNPNKLSKSVTFDTKTKMIKLKSAGKATLSVKIDIQQQSEEPVNVPPPMIIGNTGYLVLTGTDAQLAAQLNNLAAKNVHVQDTVLLQTGITDKLERQLEELVRNRNQILQRMRDKENMLEPRRTKYLPKQVKYK